MRSLLANIKANSVALTCLFIASLLCLVAFPRVLVASSALPSAVTIFALESNFPVSVDEILIAEKGLHDALNYGVDTAATNSQLSYLGIYKLTNVLPTNDAHQELQLVRQQVENALRLRPLDAYLWTRYVHVSYLLDGLSPYTLAALARSFQYGSDEYELFKFRMALCVKEWRSLPSSLQQLTRKQILYGAAQKRLWGQLLADMDTEAGEQLLALLEEASVDTKEIEQRARWIKQTRQ